MTLDFRTAIRDALSEELARDERVIFFGEDVAAAGGVFNATPKLVERVGSDRVFDTPISELALAGAAFGSAISGLRPVIEIMLGDFLALTMDSLINQAAKYRYVSNEQHSVPLVARSAVGAGGRFGAMHSQNPSAWLLGVPGIKNCVPEHSWRCQGDAQGGDPGREPRRVPRAQAAVLDPGRGTRHGDSAAWFRSRGTGGDRRHTRLGDEGRP